ncbi:MAG TPA: hypothetical protein DF613_08165 [Lachnospiraceae bacterium]|nr:hypothetical protein [Lachnospiraceae bacterium]
MKGFYRDNQLFSLCGLNCGLCPMHLNKYCPGCGGGEGNQSCKNAKCSLEHSSVEYCFQCSEYPCEKYNHIDDFDSFITHRNRKTDLDKAKEIGIEAYNTEQTEKIGILNSLLANYNDGRKKNLFCIAVNLLELQDIKRILLQIENNPEPEEFTFKKQCSVVAGLFKNAAKQKNIELKLRKKK